MTARNRSLCLRFLPLLFTMWILAATDIEADDDFPPTYVQAFLGAAQFNGDRLTFCERSSDDSADITSNDLSTMPYLGIGGQYAFSEASTHFGIDTTALFGWRSSSRSSAADNGQTRIRPETKLWLLDLAMGLYTQTIFGENWRIYAAAGPLKMIGQHSGRGQKG